MRYKIILVILSLLFLTQIIYTQNMGWQLKKNGFVTGDPIYTDRINNAVFFGGDSIIYTSNLDCKMFYRFGNPVPEIKEIKTIFRSHLRSNEFVVAGQISTSNTGRIYKSYDNCLTWNLIGNYSFAYFGAPVTQDYNNPDLLYTVNGSTFQNSMDFGTTWNDVAYNIPCPTPCDLEVFKDSSNIILIGDNGTGIFRSTDYGITWVQTFSTSGEIPVIAIKKTYNNVAFATRWGGSGTNRVVKSTDHGLTWQQLDGPFSIENTETWGIDIFNNDSSYMAIGEFSPWGRIYISSDYGNSWETIPNTIDPTNFAVEFISDSILLSANGVGLYKLRSLPITTESNIKLVFNIDINDAIDFNTKVRIDTITNGVWIKGSLNALGNNSGNWTFSDTLNNSIIPLKDDGGGYDSIANDNIWTISLDIPKGEFVGEFSYRYGISYSGIDTINNGYGYLNNDKPGIIRTFNFQETDSSFVLNRDNWGYTTRPIISISDTNLNCQLELNDSIFLPFTISNELGTDTLNYQLTVLSDSIANSLYGNNTHQNSGQNKIYGNIFYTDRTIKLEHFEQYVNSNSSALITFLIYESDNSQNYFQRIFKRNRTITSGSGFRNSNPINIYLRPFTYYFLGISSLQSIDVPKGLNSNNKSFANNIGSSILDFVSLPQDSIIITQIDTLSFNQNIFYSAPTYWIAPTDFVSSVTGGGIDNIEFKLNSLFNLVGNYKASIIIHSNDSDNDSLMIPVLLKIVNPLDAKNEELPSKSFHLSQNYPNPFNPVTQISWHSPIAGNQTLKVYDVLGNEVATLVNEYRNAGSYEIDFNASFLSGGIYFYRLQAGSFIQTKKMILIK